VRYGLIWIFPGNPALAEERGIPEIPELEGKDRWACVPVDFTWNAHHSVIIDNVSDFSHAYLHRSYRPFVDAKLTSCEMVNDKVFLSYDTKVGRGRISGLFVDRSRVKTDHMDLCFDYPYQRSNTGDRIKHWCFLLPRNSHSTRVFFLFYFDALKIPLLPIRIPQRCMTLVLRVANRLFIRPLLAQDGFAVEAEQVGYEKHWEAPLAELNPAVSLFQQLIVRRWEEHLAESVPRGSCSQAQAL
jgi:phenylpropionate dioxygenase-like ring-hydroxylating dioxygenase large terminal subunit